MNKIVVAAAGGNNALTAGLSAGGAEAAASVLSSFLYGKEAKDLTAEQKSTISSIVGLAGIALGATTGDVATTVQSGQVAQNAVENNFLSVKEAARKNALIYKSKHEELSSNEKKELAEINRKDKARDEFIKNVCQLGNVSSSACQSALQAAWSTQADYNADIANNLKNRDVYSQDAKHLDQLVQGLSQEQVLGLQAIERIAKTSGRPVEEVAKEYDRAMALHGVVSTLAGFYGGKAISGEKVKNGGSSFNVLTEAEKQRVLDNIVNSKAGRESSNFNSYILSEKKMSQIIRLKQDIYDFRASLPSTIKKSGNAASAELKIEGITDSKLLAHSRINTSDPERNIVGTTYGIFKTEKLPTASGMMVDRATDSEAKIFEYLAQKLGNRSLAKGSITIMTERPACSSCLGVAEQFKSKYPNITVIITDNDEVILNPNRKAK